MTDILQDLRNVMAEIDSGKADSDTLDISTIYILVSRAAVEIGRLRNANSNIEDEIGRLRDANSDMEGEIGRLRDADNLHKMR